MGYCLRWVYVFLVLILSVSFSCVSAAEEKDWAVIVYIAADNDLERFAYYDLLELESTKPDNTDVVVLVDRSRDDYSGWKNWFGARLYSMTRGIFIDSYDDFYGNGEVEKIPDLASPVIQDLGEINSADPKYLQDFIRYVAEHHKAKHYALVAWDHGGGWSAMLADLSGNSARFMNTKQFAEALKNSASALPNKKFDLILMDMCLMAQLDFLYDVRNLTDYVVASAPNAPGFGSDYRALMDLFGKNLDPEAVGRGIIDANTDFYDNVFVQPSSFTLFRTDMMMPVVVGMRKLVDQLNRKVDTDSYRQTVNIGLSSHYANQLGYDDQKLGQNAVSSVDLIDWLNRVEASSTVYEPIVSNLREKIGKFSIYTRASKAISGTNGISVYLPISRGNVKPGYYDTDFARVTGFADYLKNLYMRQEIGSSTNPSVSNVEVGYAVPRQGADLSDPKNFDIRPADTIVPLTQASLRFDINGENILWTKLLQRSSSSPEFTGRFRIDIVSLLVDLKKQYKIDEKQRQGKSNDIMPDYNNGTTSFLREMTAQRFVVSDRSSISPVTLYHDSLDFSDMYVEGLYYSDVTGREIPVKASFNTNTLRLLKLVDNAGKPVVVKGNGYFKPAVLYVTLDASKNASYEYVYGAPLQVSSPDDLVVLLSNLEQGEYVSYGIQTMTLDNKSDSGFTRSVKVDNIRSQLKMNRDTYNSDLSSVYGTYSVAEYVRMSSNQTQMMPLFNTMTLQPSKDVQGTIEWNIDGRLKGLAEVVGVDDPKGLTPIHMLFYTEDELKKGRNAEVMGSFLVFVTGSGKNRNLSMIRIGTGDRMGFYPLDNLTGDDFDGMWVGSEDTLFVQGNNMRIDSVVGSEKNKLSLIGTYELKGNTIILKTSEYTYKFAFVLDNANNRLTMVSENMTRMVLDKSAGSSGRTMAELRKMFSGEWYEEKTKTVLKISRVENTPYLRLIFESSGRKSQATGAFNDDTFFLTYSGGTRLKVGYKLDGDKLVMDFGESGNFVFTRKK